MTERGNVGFQMRCANTIVTRRSRVAAVMETYNLCWKNHVLNLLRMVAGRGPERKSSVSVWRWPAGCKAQG